MTVTSAEGTETGFVSLTVTPSKPEGQLYKIKIGDEAPVVTEYTNVKNWTAWDGEEEIEVESGKVVTVVECGKNYYADKVGSVTIE